MKYSIGNIKRKKNIEKFIERTIEDFVIDDSVTIIYAYTFAACSSLKSITLPRTLKEIKSSAFMSCSSLEDIVFLGTKSDWEKIILGSGWNGNAPAAYIQCTDGTITL